jgi:hypothetical protein
VNVARVIAAVHIILSLPCGDKNGQNLPVKYWELVADKLSKAGWSLGWVSAVDSEGEQSGLLTHIATTERGLSLAAMKS